VTCGEAFECPTCESKWHTQAQLHAKLSFFSLAYLQTLDFRKLTLFSNAYKLFNAEMCPGCKVSIVRTGGCKFMECAKCKYQFCWYCLDEFYTEYHYNTTDCPFRYCLLHSVEVAGIILLLVKLLVISPSVLNLFMLFLSILKACLVLVAFLAQIYFIKQQIATVDKSKRKHDRAQKRTKGRLNIPTPERRKLARLNSACKT
jgi:hypothetical protein